MRSFSHELVHHAQNCRGDFGGGIATVDGYAQEDGHLREMEREAYERGNLIFRDWEDGMKSENSSLFNSKISIGEKLMENEEMENKETKLREVIRGLVQEVLININEDEDEDESNDGYTTMADNPAPEEEAEAEEKEAEDEDDEKQNESFYPTDYDIRTKSRLQTNEALMKQWGYVKKEK